MNSGKSSKKIKKPAAGTDAPLFSVIVLTFQQRHLLEDCLDSIFQQTYPNIELVICDDCSADFDEEEVRQYIDENKNDNIQNVIVYKQLHNVGTTANAQKGIELSHGEYFKLHAGDDMLYDETTLTCMEEHLRTRETNIVAARAQACTYDGTLVADYYPSYAAVSKMMSATAQEQFVMMATQSWGEYINAPAVFWRRSFFDKIGGFDPKYKYTEDWPMWLKITKAGFRITSINTITTIYRYGGISNDSSSLNLVLGSAHYNECIKMLEEVLPLFEKANKRFKVIRCKQSIWCLKARITHETKWNHWSFTQKILWKCRNAKQLLLSWAYRRITWGTEINIRREGMMIFGVWVMYRLHVQIWPSIDSNKIWGIMLLIMLFFTALKVILLSVVKFGISRISLAKGRKD